MARTANLACGRELVVVTVTSSARSMMRSHCCREHGAVPASTIATRFFHGLEHAQTDSGTPEGGCRLPWREMDSTDSSSAGAARRASRAARGRRRAVDGRCSPPPTPCRAVRSSGSPLARPGVVRSMTHAPNPGGGPRSGYPSRDAPAPTRAGPRLAAELGTGTSGRIAPRTSGAGDGTTSQGETRISSKRRSRAACTPLAHAHAPAGALALGPRRPPCLRRGELSP